MVTDSSALVAILLREPDADVLAAAILAARARMIGGPSYLETAMVLIGRHGPAARGTLDRFIAGIAAEIMPFSAKQANIAVEAFLCYGRGRGQSGRLNFGDCCSYAVASETGQPLLCKGEDFAATDVVAALGPPAA
jgi:ribonuclease VapC